jgi:hypothetical protein
MFGKVAIVAILPSLPLQDFQAHSVRNEACGTQRHGEERSVGFGGEDVRLIACRDLTVRLNLAFAIPPRGERVIRSEELRSGRVAMWSP